MVQKLGNTFDLFNLVRQFKFPPPLIEEYIDLEIEAQQLNMELPSKNNFKEIIKFAVKPIRVIPITQSVQSARKDICGSFSKGYQSLQRNIEMSQYFIQRCFHTYER